MTRANIPHLGIVSDDVRVGPSTANVGNDMQRNADLLRYRLTGDPFAHRIANLADLTVAKLCAVMRPAALDLIGVFSRMMRIAAPDLLWRFVCPMVAAIFVFAKAKAVGGVLLRGRPSQIFRSIVHPVAVTVRAMRFAFRLRPIEDRANDSVNRLLDVHAADAERLHEIASAHERAENPASAILDSPLSGNEVAGCKGYCSPLFGAKIGVSHSVLSSRSWSGPGPLCNQRFRPDLYSRLCPSLQGIAA